MYKQYFIQISQDSIIDCIIKFIMISIFLLTYNRKNELRLS